MQHDDAHDHGRQRQSRVRQDLEGAPAAEATETERQPEREADDEREHAVEIAATLVVTDSRVSRNGSPWTMSGTALLI